MRPVCYFIFKWWELGSNESTKTYKNTVKNFPTGV